MLSDPAVAESHGVSPTFADVEQTAAAMAWAWRHHGVHKWLAYDRVTGETVGRGGCSRVPIDADWGRLYTFLPDAEWVTAPHASTEPVPVHANWVEIGRPNARYAPLPPPEGGSTDRILNRAFGREHERAIAADRCA